MDGESWLRVLLVLVGYAGGFLGGGIYALRRFESLLSRREGLGRLKSLREFRKLVEELDPAEYSVGFKFKVFALLDEMMAEGGKP